MCVIGASVVPFLVAWLWLYTSRTHPVVWMGEGDVFVWFGCIVFGIAALCALPVERILRVTLCLAYAPSMAVSLAYFALIYVCFAFDHCL